MERRYPAERFYEPNFPVVFANEQHSSKRCVRTLLTASPMLKDHRPLRL
jgi:hypothetical protein